VSVQTWLAFFICSKNLKLKPKHAYFWLKLESLYFNFVTYLSPTEIKSDEKISTKKIPKLKFCLIINNNINIIKNNNYY
jgi:hypothetical protein